MPVFAWPLMALGFIGRHGTVAIALSRLLGCALPFLSATMRPFLDEAVLTMLTLSFLRIGFQALGTEFKAPWTLIAAVAGAMFLLPAAVLWVGDAFGLHENHPDIYLALFIALAVPPITAVPIFAALLRLPGAVALAFMIIAMVATPFAATLHANHFFSEAQLPFDGVTIGLRLAGFLLGAAALAAIIQRLVGRPWLLRWQSQMDGVNVLVLFLFAVAVMDGVGPAIINHPLLILGLLVATFALALGQMGLMRIALFFLDGQKAMAIAMATGLRNMGLMVAALGMSIPEVTWLWFAIGQFPIFFMPWLIQHVRARRGIEPATQQE